MALQFRKSMKIGPGVRLNASKSGLGVSAGPRGARISKHTSGRTTKSVGIPGSGVRYQTTSTGRSRAKAATQAPPPALPKPGVFAPAYEKAFAKGVTLFVQGEPEQALWHFQDAAYKDKDANKSIADDLFAGIVSVQLGQLDQAIPYLERVVASPTELPDALMTKYGVTAETSIAITPQVAMTVPLGSTAAALALAEAYQREGRRDEAIGLIQQLVEVERQTPLVLSLADLLAEAEAWDEVVEVTAGTNNEDDATLAICVLQGQALEEQGMDDAALEVYRDALRSKKRNADLLKAARYRRGLVYIRLGKKAQGKKDLGRLYADDPGYEDVAELLQGEYPSDP